MPAAVEVGQNWSVWVPGRRQWLLAVVICCSNGKATLKYDPRYRIAPGDEEYSADESTMLTAPNLFRLITNYEPH